MPVLQRLSIATIGQKWSTGTREVSYLGLESLFNFLHLIYVFTLIIKYIK